MYEVGSIADIISGSQSTCKKTLEVQEVKPEISMDVDQTQSENIPHSENVPDSVNVPDSKTKIDKTEPKAPRMKRPKKDKLQKNKNKNDPNQTGPYKLKRKATDDELEQPISKKQKKDPERIKNSIQEPTDPDQMKNDEETNLKTIYVGNVPLNTKKSEIKNIFSVYGPVHTLRFRGVPAVAGKTPKASLLEKTFHPNRQSLQCYVVFTNAEDAQKALKANGKEFQGQHLRVNMCQTPDPDEKKAIFIGNLPFDVEDDDIWKLFQQCGLIFSVRIVRDQATQMGKGFGYVNFDSTDSVELALQMENVKLNNRVLRISRSCNNGNKKKRSVDVKKSFSKPKPIKKTKEVAETSEFLGSKFTDKKKKKKINKSKLVKKKMIKILNA